MEEQSSPSAYNSKTSKNNLESLITGQMDLILLGGSTLSMHSKI